VTRPSSSVIFDAIHDNVATKADAQAGEAVTRVTSRGSAVVKGTGDPEPVTQ
jgi:hypothetical protein